MKEIFELFFIIVFGCIFVLNMPLMLAIITNVSLKHLIKTPAKNNVTGDTPQQRVREFRCRIRGCIITGSYYQMPQATCRRCGHKNPCAQPQIPEWREPYD